MASMRNIGSPNKLIAASQKGRSPVRELFIGSSNDVMAYKSHAYVQSVTDLLPAVLTALISGSIFLTSYAVKTGKKRLGVRKSGRDED